MKAFVKRSVSDDGIEFCDVPCPEVGESELLVRVQAIGVGIHDGYFLPAVASYPYVIGIEAAGIVEQAGGAVERFRLGERVAFVSAMQPKGGAWAEYAVVDSRALIVRIPDAMTFETAAALPVAGNTALRAFRCLQLESGKCLFIAGGAGAIGTLAIQIAAERGYRVAASASKQNHSYLRSLGTEIAVDYHDPDWSNEIISNYSGGVDAAIGIHPGTAHQCEAVVRNGGTIVAISGDRFDPERGIELKQLPHDTDVKAELEQLVGQVASWKMCVEIGQVYPFAEGLDALARVATRHTRGKLVLTLG